MRHPSILDAVRAITAIAHSYPQVATWWYAPNPRFRLRGEVGKNLERATPLEVVLQMRDGQVVDLTAIGDAVSRQVIGHPVTARLHQGESEKRLFRVLTTDEETNAGR